MMRQCSGMSTKYTSSDGKGETIYTWETRSQSHSAMYFKTFPFAVGSTRDIVKRRSLYVRPDGIIYGWNTYGY